MAARNYQGKESEQSKARRKKKQRNSQNAEVLIAGMQGNRNNMPTLGSEYFRKKRR